MGACVKYLHTDPKSKSLIYRRAFSPDLLRFIPGGRRELKVTLGSKVYDTAAAARFAKAGAEFERIVKFARRKAEGTYDALDEPLIKYLADTFLHDHLELDEASRWRSTSRAWAYPSRRDYEGDYEECRALLEDYDGDGLVEFWRDWACEFTTAMGFVLDPTTPAFAQLCRALGEASCQLWLAIDARIDRRHAATPPRPILPDQGGAVPSPADSRSGSGESFEQIAESLLTSERLAIGASTRQATRSALRFLKEAHGDIHPGAITRAAVSEWLDLLAKRPAKLLGADRGLQLRELAALYDGRDVPRMSPKTIAQHTGMLAALWNKAQDEGAISEDLPNPFKRRGLKANTKPKQHVELSPEETSAIFALPVFTEGERPKGGKGEACYWIPLLLLYTGARPEEMAQLIVDDIFHDPEDNRWKLRITDEGVHPIKGERSLKTSRSQSGRRVIPIPSPLLELGFLAFVESARKTGNGALFPRLKTKGERGLLFEPFGAWWSKYLRSHNVVLAGEGRKPAREFRHVWTTAARASGVPREAMEYIQGHKALNGSAHEVYGSKEPLGNHIDKVHFAKVDLSGVKPWAV